MSSYSQEILPNARGLRQRMTEAETLLWRSLKAHRLGGYKFRRQQPVASYVVDFFCSQAKLILELDGGYHQEEAQRKQDDARDAFMREAGYEVLRFSNSEVLGNLPDVLRRIQERLKERGGMR